MITLATIMRMATATTIKRNYFIVVSVGLALATIICGACTLVKAQDIPWTPLSGGSLTRVSIEVPPAFNGLNLVAGVHDVFLPEGWNAKVFFAGAALGKPRFMSFGPDSVLFVANMGKNQILALPDANADGVCDQAVVAATTSGQCHDVKFYRDTMFICQEAGVEKLWRSSGTGLVYDQRLRIIDKSSQPNQTGGNHRTRTLVIDSLNKKLYVSVGSRGNADRESDRALIEEYNWDGTGRRVYASGIRNAVGITLHPRTGKLWANNNGSDLQGNNVPPEWIDIVRDGGFYGYPYAYHTQNFFNMEQSSYADIKPITGSDSANVSKMVPPAALITAHSAPMAITFSHQAMPDGYRNGAFMALRGSWNRSPISGTKVVYLDFDNDADTIANVAVDFCRGFLIDSNDQGTRWARPVGVSLAADGAVYLSSDDLKVFILKLTPPVKTSIRQSYNNEGDGRGGYEDEILVESSNDAVNVLLPLTWESASVSVFTSSGKVVATKNVERIGEFSITELASGTYFVQATSMKKTLTGAFTITK